MALTKEREADIRSRAALWPVALADAAVLLTEIDRLRALPVLRTCAPCRHWRSVTAFHDEPDVIRCEALSPPLPIDVDAPPPDRCPLRGAR